MPPLDSGVQSWQCNDPMCAGPEQVFLDGNQLTEVSSGSTPGSGQFSLNGARHVVLGDSPNAHSIEVSTRQAWLVAAADNVTIQGFVMRHAANSVNFGAVANNGHNSWTVQGNGLYSAHGPIVMIGGGSGAKILRNDIGGSGYLGIGSFNDNGSLIQGNHIWYNNTAGFFLDWSGGGVKLVHSSNAVMDGNDAHDNNGPGLWCDLNCSNITYSTNRVYYNVGRRSPGTGSPQVFFEISDGASIRGNVVWGTIGGWPGIYVSSSANADVSGNVVAWSDRGIQAYEQNRCCHSAQANVNIHNNWVAMAPTGTLAVMWGDDFGGSPITSPSRNNRGSGNIFFYPGGENGQPRFQWGSQMFSSLGGFGSTPAGGSSMYVPAWDNTNLLNQYGVPSTPPGAAAIQAHVASTGTQVKLAKGLQ
ncbi:MAG: right-handed parallel beta-helix repeat-containing protein [Chloroflexota bacterium]|nr:right-handed parallel beta-helix repeat-containing protein [Chloroflexota bacterium]